MKGTADEKDHHESGELLQTMKLRPDILVAIRF